MTRLLVPLSAATIVLALLSVTSRPGNPSPEWTLMADDVTATVYNAVPGQCNDDHLHTASMYAIVPERITEERILAMERTMMAEFDISYGDTVRVEGTVLWDGEWQVQDTMNKRYAGQHKIDFLVPDHIRHGRWTDVKIYRKTAPGFR